ncbi:MAG: FAD-dependent oxidoreductase [Nanoarchaeota archaeon]
MQKKKVIILGAGITGLVSAYYLSQNKNFEVVLIEKESFIGGTARGFKHKEFILDYGPHKLYTELPGIMDEIKQVVPLLKIKKKNSIYLKNNSFDFPLQISQIASKIPFTAFNAGVDIFSKSLKKLPDNSYENYLINRFGKTMYELSFKDYAKKVWTTNPQDLDKELAIRRVSISGIFELIKGILFKDTKNISAEYFYYPPKGIKQLLDSLVEKIKQNKGKILLNTEISEIKIKDKKIEYLKIKNRKIKPDYFISTAYLDTVIKIINDKEKTKELIQSAENLVYQGINIIYFVINKPKILKDCWRFFPEAKFLFHRISEQKAFSHELGPKDKTILMVETTKDASKENIQKIISQLEKIKILKKEDIDYHFVKSTERTYPIYKKGFKKNLFPVINYLENIKGFYTIGRPGLFNYNNMDQCWDMAKKTVEHIEKNKPKEQWQKTKKYFDKYRIVD